MGKIINLSDILEDKHKHQTVQPDALAEDILKFLYTISSEEEREALISIQDSLDDLKHDPDNIVSLLKLADSIDYIDEDSDEPFKIYSRVLTLDPNNHKALIGLGQIFERKGKYAKAETLFRVAIDIASKSDDSYALVCDYNLLGEMYEKMGDNERAISSYEKVVEIKDSVKFRYNLACKYKKYDRFDEAIKIFMDIILQFHETHESANIQEDDIDVELERICYVNSLFDLAIIYNTIGDEINRNYVLELIERSPFVKERDITFIEAFYEMMK